MQNHYNIKPIRAFVNDSLLYNVNTDTRTPCTIIGLSVYKDEVVTFDIVLSNGSMFSYIPFHQIFYADTSVKKQLSDLVYHNSESTEVAINYIDYLKNNEIYVYFKNLKIWLDCDEYICTLDWYKGNDLLHLLKVDGNFVLMPSHKIKVGVKLLEFEKYSKIRSTFTV